MKKLSTKLAKLSNTYQAQLIVGEFDTLSELIGAGLKPKDGSLAIISSIGAVYTYDLETDTWSNTGTGGGITEILEDLTPQLGGNLDLNGNSITGTGTINITGTINGRTLSADGTKLDGIEANAAADQTGAEIKALYEAEADTNAFTDSLLSKLNGIEASATADQTGAEIVSAIDTQLGSTAWQSGGSGSTDLSYTASTGVIASSSGADATITLADGTNRGLMSNTDFTKLASIEASADVTDDANVKAALDGMTLTDAGTPASNDKVLIQDTSDSNNLKYVQVSTLGGGTSDHGALTGLGDDDHTQYAIISSGAGAPASTPSRVGAIYVDTTADVFYVATGTASAADWSEQTLVDGTGLNNGEIIIWDTANSKFIRDNREVNTAAVSTVNMNSIMGNYYSTTTSATAGTITLANPIAGGRSTIRIENSTAGGPTISGSGITVTKLGDWTTNYSTTGINTVYIEMVTATLAYCWITAVD